MLSVENLLEEKIAVIADDLTGANEIAAILVRKRKKCLVLNRPLAHSKMEKLWDKYHGLVFDLASRNLSPEKAYGNVRGFLSSSEEIRKRVIYKKIDSTLRGNVAKEIDAVLDARWIDFVILVPALPRMKRITVGGYHLVDGLPLGRTSYADNSTESSLTKLIQTQSSYGAGYVDLATVESGPRAISQELIRTYQKGSPIAVCDCCSGDDLKNIKEAILNLDVRVLPVGSAGLFEELFCQDEPPFLPCLVVCGSLNRLTRLQLSKLMNQEKTGYLELNLSSLLFGKDQNELKRLRLEGKAILDQGSNLVIATPEKRWETRKEQKIGILQSKINRSLASLAKYFIQSFPLAGLIATGGDTATSLLDKLGAEGVEVLQELEPLVPIAILKGIKGKELVLVTKTGGFGTEDVFLNAIDYLTKRSKKD